MLLTIIGAFPAAGGNLLGNLIDLVLYGSHFAGINAAVDSRTIFAGIGGSAIDGHVAAGSILLVVADRISAVIVAAGVEGVCYGGRLCLAIVIDGACGNGQTAAVLIILTGAGGADTLCGDLIAACRQFPLVLVLFRAADTLLGVVIIAVVFRHRFLTYGAGAGMLCAVIGVVAKTAILIAEGETTVRANLFVPTIVVILVLKVSVRHGFGGGSLSSANRACYIMTSIVTDIASSIAVSRHSLPAFVARSAMGIAAIILTPTRNAMVASIRRMDMHRRDEGHDHNHCQQQA